MQVFDFARNWSSLLTRLGIGLIFLWFLQATGILNANFELGNTTSVETLGKLALGLIVSLVIGGVAVDIGQLAFRSEFNITDLALIAKKVGETNNPLLIERLRDAFNKMELAAGLAGLVVSCLVIVAIASAVPSANNNLEIPSLPENSFVNSVSSWALTVFSFVCGLILRKSAIIHLEAIVSVISPPEERPKE